MYEVPCVNLGTRGVAVLIRLISNKNLLESTFSKCCLNFIGETELCGLL